MRNKRRVIILITSFLLMIPFRLPISVLFIWLITDIANIAGNLPDGILAANVVVTKIIYDLALAVFSIRAIFNLGVKYFKKDDGDAFPLLVILPGFMYVGYIIFDAWTTYDLFFVLKN